MTATPATSHLCVARAFWRVVGTVMATAFLWSGAAPVHSAPAKGPGAFGKLQRCKPGPWGDLRYYEIYLEMPDYLVKLCGEPDPAPKWSFPGVTDDGLRALFKEAGLPASFQEYLLDPRHQQLKDHVLTVLPPVPDLVGMTPGQRAVIYRELAKSELNEYYANPICIMSGDADSWFATSGLRPELREAVKKMSYRRGDMLCFSDLGALLSMAKPGQEAHEVLKAMTRIRTLMLELSVKPDSNLEQVMRYWSCDKRNKDVEAILLSVAETEGVERLDCTHLLPPLARRYLYTYPSEDPTALPARPDCHWTSLNFFDSRPLDYHLNPELFFQRVTQDYLPVKEPYSFGDVLMFTTAEGTPLHSCVYIADDIVYTKNGRNVASPWLLMKLDDVRRYYGAGQTSLMQGYRLKPEQE